MKLQHLKVFVAIVQYGGVIKAAEQLHVTQPALSASLKALEDDLGVKLFLRSRGNRGMRLTSEGQRFHARALAILRECEITRAELRSETRPPERLRLGLLDTLLAAWVEDFLSALRDALTSHSIVLWEGSAERIAAWLEQGRLDCAVTTIAEKSAGTHPLWREPFVAVFPPHHPWAGRSRRTVSLRELAQTPFVFRSNCELSPVGEAQLRAAGVRLDVAVRAAGEKLAFAAVKNGYGVTLAPRTMVPAELASAAVSGLSLSRTIGLQWHAGFDPALAAALRKIAVRAGQVQRGRAAAKRSTRSGAAGSR